MNFAFSEEQEELRRIVRQFLDDKSDEQAVRALMATEKGYDDAFGARPLARVIQDHIKKPLADEILFGKLKDGGTVRVLLDREKDSLAFEFIPADAKPRPPASRNKKKPEPEESV